MILKKINHHILIDIMRRNPLKKTLNKFSLMNKKKLKIQKVKTKIKSKKLKNQSVLILEI